MHDTALEERLYWFSQVSHVALRASPSKPAPFGPIHPHYAICTPESTHSSTLIKLWAVGQVTPQPKGERACWVNAAVNATQHVPWEVRWAVCMHAPGDNHKKERKRKKNLLLLTENAWHGFAMNEIILFRQPEIILKNNREKSEAHPQQHIH